MATLQQHIFPPKPKTVITPLSPRKQAATDVTPLSPKEDIADAIASRKVDPVAEPEPEPQAERKPATKARNRLLTGKGQI